MILKIKRTLSSVLPVDSSRSGKCNNCGACCKLPKRCVFLKTEKGGKEYCSVYKVRPLNCRKFPRTVQDFDLVEEDCSFSFQTANKPVISN